MLRAEGADDGGALTREVAGLQREVDALLLEEQRARPGLGRAVVVCHLPPTSYHMR